MSSTDKSQAMDYMTSGIVIWNIFVDLFCIEE